VSAITAKVLHEKTAECLDRVRQGERLRVVWGRKHEAWLVPAGAAEDPPWSEIMKDVWAAQKLGGEIRRNPVLAERHRRNHAARLR